MCVLVPGVCVFVDSQEMIGESWKGPSVRKGFECLNDEALFKWNISQPCGVWVKNNMMIMIMTPYFVNSKSSKLANCAVS